MLDSTVTLRREPRRSAVQVYLLSSVVNCLLFLVGIRLEERVEVAHREVVTPDDTHVGDGFAVFIQSLDGCDDIIQMLLRETAAVDGEAHDVCKLCLLLRGLEVVFHGIVAQLGDADAVAADQFEREAFAREGLVAALAVEELIHVDVHSMAPAGRTTPLTPAL